ncbi:hypothetical protein RxyAA322_05070 [Rubrobacter xylanophilus]|uniref:Alkyl hydroperoxide reductase subunit C/ Thiol specific antioxidant domain-containing protein n=1 Tax=Rubrobacter xylanophilus TaxID=49319 RepID=A0A510HJ08_9ACTN|nr:hypothetical protein [Rubrobacter xylanophilus]BBL78653.1 hypothetical protein RxyAA322_05070 [Rubrobacter xylanophilus]
MALFRKNGSAAPLGSGEKAPNFQLSSAQGGVFRLDMRTAHGPVVLAFVDAGSEGDGLLQLLKEHQTDFQRAAVAERFRAREKSRASGEAYLRIGPTVTTTVAAIVRAESMEQVKELQERLRLPYYVLWDETDWVSGMYGVPKGKTAVALVQSDRTLRWFPEVVESLQVEPILQAIFPPREEEQSSGA